MTENEAKEMRKKELSELFFSFFLSFLILCKEKHSYIDYSGFSFCFNFFGIIQKLFNAWN